MVELSHPATMELGQIVVDGNHVDTPTGQSIQIDRSGSDQCLTFAGLHLGDITLV